jgi:predicted P-loop ATPase
MASLLEQLQALPDHWAYVAIGPNKRPYIKEWDWAEQPMTKAQMAAEITSGRAQAIGVQAGPASGGLLFVDHDGISATAQLERLGIPLRSLPKSWAMTSGRDGRFQIIYTIPEQFWPALRNRRYWHTGDPDPETGRPTKVFGPEGKAEQIDLRWARHYSVVAGHHPETTGYRWLTGRGPGEQELVDAPTALIELLLDQPEPDPLPLFTPEAVPARGPGEPLPLLDFISRASRTLIESGGTPGSWNDDQLRLALDLRGTELWIRSQGHQPDITASKAFALHIQAASSKATDFDERKAWRRFDGADGRTPRPSTPEDKLQDRLRYHTRTGRPILPPPPAAPLDPQQSSPRSAAAPLDPPPPPPQQQQSYAPSLAKPQKLEAAELLFMLRQQANDGQRIRWNTFHQQVELDGKALEGAERFYLSLADQGFKVSKELAIDALVQVAREHPYDPVTLYLDHVAATVEPAYIGGLATAYLRPEDAAHAGTTLYDHMIRCTLIGAVRRAFEPGTKHDTTCILSGDQGARKSSFWSVLGGAFFSDSLGDLSSKDDLLKLHRSWIMEWAELDHVTSRKAAGQIKAFLTTQSDLFRAPYGKAVEATPRRGVIVGSTNRTEGFLVDDTGNRRFWVIPTSRTEADPIDTPTLAAERDAIWSAAVHAHRAGEPNFLPVDLALQVNRENEAYQVSNPWREPIEAWLRAPANAGRVITSELLLTEAVQKPVGQQTRADQMQVGSIMREVGWSKRRASVDGRLKWVFFQPR